MPDHQPGTFFPPPNLPDLPVSSTEFAAMLSPSIVASAKACMAHLAALHAARPIHPLEWLLRRGEQVACDLLDGTTGKELYRQFIQQTGSDLHYATFCLAVKDFRQLKGLPSARKPRRAV